MFFTSYEFIGFLVLTVVLYYLVPKKIQPYFLLLVSYLFYLTQGAGCLVYIALITAIAYVSAMAIEHNREKQKRCVQSDESLFCAGNALSLRYGYIEQNGGIYGRNKEKKYGF